MTKIIQRHDTSTNWTSINPILALGEMGIETDTNKFKFGDGVTNWSELAYSSTEIDLSNYYDKETTDALLDTKQDVLTAGTNITIENNVISATGGGGADLSDYYTKEETYNQEEVDTLLDAKQDALTPVLPITIQEKIKSNTVGMSYTSGYTGVYSTTGSSYNIQNVSPMYARGTTTFNSTWDENSIKSYIDVPYQIGDIVTTGAFGTFYNGSIVFGKVLPNGTFIPIVNSAGTTVSINDIVTITDSTTATMDTVTTTYTRGDASSSAIKNVPYKNKQQIVQIQRSGSGYTFSVIKTNGTGSLINSYVYTVSDNINRIAEINTARITPAGTSSDGVGVTSSNAYPVASIGSYSFSGTFGIDTCDFSTLVNKFDLSDVQVNTYLEVKYDNQTIQVNSDGELVANLDELGNEVNSLAGRVTGVETNLTGKADVDGTNMVASVKNFDGQWVIDCRDLFETTAVGTYTVDLSTYLPDDGYIYDVIFNHRMYCTTDCAVSVVSDLIVVEGQSQYVGQTSSNSRYNSNRFTMPVGTGRTVRIQTSSNNAGQNVLSVIGYRRLGTNQ